MTLNLARRTHLERSEVHGGMSDHAAQRECVADDPPGTLERRGWYKSGRKRRTEAAVATVREHIVTGANLIARALRTLDAWDPRTLDP